MRGHIIKKECIIEMASSEVKTMPIRISSKLKNQLEEYKHPGQSYSGFIEELLTIAREATGDFVGVRGYVRSAQKHMAEKHARENTE